MENTIVPYGGRWQDIDYRTYFVEINDLANVHKRIGLGTLVDKNPINLQADVDRFFDAMAADKNGDFLVGITDAFDACFGQGNWEPTTSAMVGVNIVHLLVDVRPTVHRAGIVALKKHFELAGVAAWIDVDGPSGFGPDSGRALLSNSICPN